MKPTQVKAPLPAPAQESTVKKTTPAPGKVGARPTQARRGALTPAAGTQKTQKDSENTEESDSEEEPPTGRPGQVRSPTGAQHPSCTGPTIAEGVAVWLAPLLGKSPLRGGREEPYAGGRAGTLASGKYSVVHAQAWMGCPLHHPCHPHPCWFCDLWLLRPALSRHLPLTPCP